MSIITMAFFFYFIRDDFLTVKILLSGGRKNLWIMEVYRSFLFSLTTTTVITLIVLIIGTLITQTAMNWTSTASVFCRATGYPNSSWNIFMLIILFLLCTTLRFMFSCLLLLNIYWITNSRVYAFVFTVILGTLEYSLPLFYRRVAMDYLSLSASFKTSLNYFIGLVIILGLTLPGWIFSKRKDFL